jgi:iron complex outermembrane recepter protein
MTKPPRPYKAAAVFLSSMSIVASVMPAAAQTAVAGVSKVDDIVITAQRRAQSSQQVPIAVTVLKGEALVQRGITNIKGIETVTPSFEVEQTFGTGQPVFTLRGVGFDDYTANNAPTVGIYVDDVAYTVPVMTQGSLFDISRVEVLRGPQGTLYGRNTTGGAVAFVSNRATDALEAGASADYGRFNAWKLDGYVSGALGHNVRARAAFITEQGGGYQKNRRSGEKLGDANRFAARLSFEFGNEDSAMLRVNGHYYRDKSDGLGAYLLAPLVSGGSTIPADSNRLLTDWGASPTFFAQTKVPVNSKPFRDNEGLGFSFYGTVNLGSAQFTSITAYEKLNRREFNDFDGTAINVAGTLFNSKPEVLSQELRLSSVGEQSVNWVAGAYYAGETLSDDFRSDFADSLGFTVSTTYKQKVRTLAGFGHIDARIAEKFTLTAGLRYENEKRELLGLTTRIPEFNVPFATNVNRVSKLSEVSGKLGIAYELTDKSRVFASISRGVKSGGFTTYNTLVPQQADPFRPEVLISYEVGLKSDFADGKLRANLAAFYYDYKNQQIQGFYIDPTFGAIGQIVNVPKSRIYGAEAEFTWEPMEALILQQSFGYKTGTFREFLDVDPGASVAVTPFRAVTVNRAGQDLPFPKFSYSGSLSYTVPAGHFAVNGLIDYNYRDKDDRSRLGSAVYSVASYWLVNARLTLRPSEDGHWSLYAYGHNLFNQGYDITRNFFLPQAQIGYRGSPATYGVGASVRF